MLHFLGEREERSQQLVTEAMFIQDYSLRQIPARISL